ncbi:hypothetical protein RBG61_04105 [Paludicola sp. MB14-C6]|uniref:hypothetical protein n=1 Tax=Paludihabitans sp. MB14-C6 TaxID=3070656 RepID=UPI0027DB85A5|nr:hypothetical protein [Paludicola sp. MB14-C6]WMJ23857.1 hypothetical protein RBG61_04105 [Paludicola sp. MB14-C6]
MKRILLTIILLTSIILAGCSSNSTSKSTKADLPKNPTVKHVVLTKEEKEIAAATCDRIAKFVFEKNKLYDITAYSYHDGALTPRPLVMKIDSKQKNIPIIFSSHSFHDEQNNMVQENWTILANETRADFPLNLFSKGKALNCAYGIGDEAFQMEKGKEYVLYYVAYKKGTEFKTKYPIFSEWDTTENKIEQLKEFDYVLLFTAKLSDTSK